MSSSWKWRPEIRGTQSITTTTTTNCAFTDYQQKWVLNSTRFLGVVVFILYQLVVTIALLLARTILFVFRLSDIVWCHSPWGTKETSFVYFRIVQCALHEACFYQRISNANLFFGPDWYHFNKKIIFQSHDLNNATIGSSKRHLNLHALKKRNLIDRFFVKRDFIDWHWEYLFR